MQYTELTRKELQREYTRLTQRYSSYMREPMELDMRAEDPLLGRCENRRAAKHFGTVLGKELSDTGAARPTPAEDAVAALCTMPGCANRTVELCRRAGVLFDAVDHSTVLRYGTPQTEQRIDLRRDADYDIDTGRYTIHLHVENGGIAFVDSPCPDHLCEGFGVLKNEGDWAACMPAKASVTIE